MESEDIKKTIKLGGFVIGGVVIFLTALFYLGREGNLFNKTFVISAIFKNVEGLKEGDNVWLSGVKIGMVKQVQIISEGQVIVQLALKDKQNEFIRNDATAFIGSDGLVGNKIVVIRPGVANQIIHDQDTINALSPTDTQELFNIAKEVGVNARSISNDLKLISERLNKGEGIFGELLHDGAISNDIRKTVKSLEMTGKNADALTAEARKIMEEIQDGDGLITRLIKDTAYAETFENTLQNVATVGENAKNMSEELKEVIDKMNSSENAIGVLLADSAFARKLRGTMDNAQSASIKLDDNMEALQHNFLFRGYFRKQKKAEERKRKNESPASQVFSAVPEE